MKRDFSFNQQISPATNWAICCYIKPYSRQAIGLTTHDVDLWIDDLQYHADAGLKFNGLYSGPKDGEGKISAFINSSYFNSQQLHNGVYDNAELTIFTIDYKTIDKGVNYHRHVLYKGFIGKLSLVDGVFTAQVNDQISLLRNQLGQLYSPQCRAQFCDDKCGLDEKKYTENGRVEKIIDNISIYDNSINSQPGWFDNGHIVWLSGANNGLTQRISAHLGGNIILLFPMEHTIVIGDTYSIMRGCNKTMQNCIYKYSNFINFRGEPQLY